MWMPALQCGTREDRLSLRQRLQVRSCLHLQALLNNTRRHFKCGKTQVWDRETPGIMKRKGCVWDTESEACSR